MSAADVITALGGPTVVARMFNVRDNTVSNWKRRGFPRSRRHEIWLECQSAGIAYDPAAPEVDIRNTTHSGPSDTRSSNMKTHIEGQQGKQILNSCDKKVTDEDSTKTLGNSIAPDGTIVTNATTDAA